MDLEGIKARADAARAPCIAYWLIVFTYLMIHLFPVGHPAQELSFTQSGPTALLNIAGDWVAPSGIDEIPILPTLPAIRPQAQYVVFTIFGVADAPQDPFAAFEPRGPPYVV